MKYLMILIGYSVNADTETGGCGLCVEMFLYCTSNHVTPLKIDISSFNVVCNIQYFAWKK